MDDFDASVYISKKATNIKTLVPYTIINLASVADILGLGISTVSIHQPF